MAENKATKMTNRGSASTIRCIVLLLTLSVGTIVIGRLSPVGAILHNGGDRHYQQQHSISEGSSASNQQQSPSIGSEGYFDGSAHAIVKSTLHIRHMTSLGFRTCSNGLLFYQSGAGGDSLKLEVVGNPAAPSAGNGTDNGSAGSRLRLKWEVGGIDGWAEVGQRLNDNRWHQVLLRYALGAVTLSVDHQEALVANATHNPELLKLDLISPNPEVVVGQGFKGCLLQGAGLVFNDTSVASVGVSWARCPMPNRGGCDGYQVDYCFSQPCHKFGVCVSLPDDYLCQCTTRYTGRNCETDTGPLCEREEFSRCRNGGVCQENKTGNSTLCACPPKFTGQFCETVIDGRLCDTNPCLNNATCHVNRFGDGYECSCRPGFAGLDCEVNIDECASSPCQHGGSCSDGVDSYSCRCQGTGYRGAHCELNIDECTESQPCRHQGRCFDNYGGYFCECPPGFLGKNCEREADECASAPCLHGATCRNQFNRYECICAPGFQGSNCEVNIDDCVNIRCPRHSHCVDKINTFQCSCDLGYTGRTHLKIAHR